jgi:hypothetical protein
VPVRVLAHRRDWVLLPDELPDANLALFDPRLERSFDPVLNRLRRQELTRSALDALVIRVSDPQTAAQIDGDTALARYLQRVPTLILCGSYDPQALQPQLRRATWSTAQVPEIEAIALRGPELAAMVQRSTAIFRHNGCHFDLPSARVHAAEFVRMADALQDVTDLVRIADWILPFLGPHAGLAADTGTLLGLMATVQHEALRRFGWRVPLAALDEYPRSDRAVEQLLANFTAAGWRDLVFLISVNSTGAVARSVTRTAPNATLVVLCETAPTADQRADSATSTAHSLHEYPILRWPLRTDQLCEKCEELQVLHVHPRTYELTANFEWVARGFAHELSPPSVPSGQQSIASTRSICTWTTRCPMGPTRRSDTSPSASTSNGCLATRCS